MKIRKIFLVLVAFCVSGVVCAKQKQDRTRAYSSKTSSAQSGVTEYASTSEFKKQAKGKCVLKLYSPSCPHCRAAEKPYEELSREMPNIKFCAVEIKNDDANVAGGEAGVPHFITFNNGKKTGSDVGFNNKNELKQFIQSH